MSTHHPHRGPRLRTAPRQATARLGRLAAALAALTFALLASAAIVPAAWANVSRPVGRQYPRPPGPVRVPPVAWRAGRSP